MARITNRDCLEKVENRFDLVLLASHRTRQIAGGAPINVPKDNDKPTIISLREIAQGFVNPSELKESLLVSLRKQQGFYEESEEELENMLALDLSEDSSEGLVLDESDLAELENSNFEIREIGAEDEDEGFVSSDRLIGEEDE